MTKAEIVLEIAKKKGIGKQETAQVLEAMMELIKETMTTGEGVYLRGFGSFVVKERAQKTARNISKNTTIVIPAHNVPTFKPAKEFTAAVRGKK